MITRAGPIEVGPLMLGLSVANQPIGSKSRGNNLQRPPPNGGLATTGRALSFTEPQRGAQHRNLARELDLDRLPGLQVPKRVRQGAKIGCFGATQNQKPV